VIVTVVLAASFCVLMVRPAGNSNRHAASMYLILAAACIWGAHWPAGYILLAANGKAGNGTTCTKGVSSPAWKGFRKS
jgi:hypothetical protein